MKIAGLVAALLACSVMAEEGAEIVKDESARAFGHGGFSSHSSHGSVSHTSTTTIHQSSSSSHGHGGFHSGPSFHSRPFHGGSFHSRPFHHGFHRSLEAPEAYSTASSAYQAPACPTNYLFSCSPHLTPVPCSQGGY